MESSTSTTSNSVTVIIQAPSQSLKTSRVGIHLHFIAVQITGLDSLTKRRQGDGTDHGSIISRNWAIVNGLVVDGQRAQNGQSDYT